MVSIASLCLPILLSAVFVFFLSWIIHMFLPYHRTDYRKLPSEADLQEALRKFNIAPGDYLLPCPEGPTGMRSPEYLDKRNKGPVAVMTVMKIWYQRAWSTTVKNSFDGLIYALFTAGTFGWLWPR